jgi:hypothetical protein
MSVIARFKVNSVENFTYGSKIKLGAVYTNNPEDPHFEEIKAFHDSTPQGTLEMVVNNPQAAEQFQPGDDYYLSFERCPDGVPA